MDIFSVSCLTWGSGVLVSGSWDHSGRIWTNWDCSHELKGHEGPLWSVVVLPSEGSTSPSILTASADKTIKLWKEGKVWLSITGNFLCFLSLLCHILMDKISWKSVWDKDNVYNSKTCHCSIWGGGRDKIGMSKGEMYGQEQVEIFLPSPAF